MLTKDELLNGAKQTIEFTPEGLDNSLYLRPLTIGELNELEQMKAKALGTYVANETSTSKGKERVKGKLNAEARLNVEKTTIAEDNANVKAVMYSIDNESNDFKLNEQEVKSLDSKVFVSILEKVKEISHWDTDEDIEEDVDDFHQD